MREAGDRRHLAQRDAAIVMLVEEAARPLEPPVELAPGRELGRLQRRRSPRGSRPSGSAIAYSTRATSSSASAGAERRIAGDAAGIIVRASGPSRSPGSRGPARGRAPDRGRTRRLAAAPGACGSSRQRPVMSVAVGADAGAAGVEIEELAGADGDGAAVDLVALVALEDELQRRRRRADRRAARPSAVHSTSLPRRRRPARRLELPVHDGEIAAHFRPVS